MSWERAYSTGSHLPDYQSLAYRKQAPRWRYLDAVYQGADAWVERLSDGTIRANALSRRFLPQMPRERSQNYESRLNGTPFSDKFAQSIRQFVGLIFSSGIRWENVPSPILDTFANLDGNGQSVDNLLIKMAIAAMRRGHTFALIDPPRWTGGRSLHDAALARPYWKHISPLDVISWRWQDTPGGKVLVQAVIVERRMVPTGAFGEELQTVYLVLTPGRYDRFRIEGQGDRRQAVYLARESGRMGIQRRDGFLPLGFVPLVVFSGGQDEENLDDPFETLPPLKALADLNLAHYQLYSEHLTKIKKTCRPIYVRVGTMGDEDELVISSDTTIDVPPGGGFLIAEPDARSIEKSRLELEAIEQAMDFLGLAFAVRPGDRQVAMVSLVQVSKVESGLTFFVNAFTSGINSALKVMGLYLGIPPERCGSARLETQFFKQVGTDADLLAAYAQFFDRLAILPPAHADLLLREMQGRGFLDESADWRSNVSQRREADV